jgi:hypothetical protein
MALHVLRNELAPLQMDPEQLLPLSRFVAKFPHYICSVGLLTSRHVQFDHVHRCSGS